MRPFPHQENESIFKNVRDTGQSVFYKDKPFLFPDQPERGVTYWDWSLSPIKSDDHLIGPAFALRETTEYKKAQDQLRLQGRVLESMAEG